MIHLPFTSSVRGVSFYPENTSKARVNGVIECIPDPGNRYDPNAIAVYQKGLHLGFLPAKLSSSIMAKTSSRDFKLLGVLSEKYFNGEFHALKIKISRLVTSDNAPQSLFNDNEMVVQNAESGTLTQKTRVSKSLAEKSTVSNDIASKVGSVSSGTKIKTEDVRAMVYNRTGRFLGKFKAITGGMVLVDLGDDIQALYPISYVRYN